MDASHPVHTTPIHIAAQVTGTASLADALARAGRIAGDLGEALAQTLAGDPTTVQLRQVLREAARQAADFADVTGERYADGWITTKRLAREVGVVAADLTKLAGLARIAWRVGAVPTDALHVAALAEGLARTLTFRAAAEAKAARKAAR